MLSRTLVVAKQTELRQHPRVPLVLSVRVRWLGALGLEQELSETLDTGRGGLLTSSAHDRSPGSPAWVTFPYDANVTSAVPEFPSRVAHCRDANDGRHFVGLAFLANKNAARGENGESRTPRGSFWRSLRASPRFAERRRTARVELALPVTIRRPGSLWADESMTSDVSSSGVAFASIQVYETGESIAIELPEGRWIASGHHAAKVVRISSVGEDSRLQDISAEFIT
jgi:hypothetical protein